MDPGDHLRSMKGKTRRTQRKETELEVNPEVSGGQEARGGIGSKNERIVWRKNITVDQRLIWLLGALLTLSSTIGKIWVAIR